MQADYPLEGGSLSLGMEPALALTVILAAQTPTRSCCKGSPRYPLMTVSLWPDDDARDSA